MKRTRKYVGLDVHQASTVVSVRGESGRVIWRTVLPTEAEALLEFVGGMQGSVQVAFEEGTQAQWLYDLLVGVVERVVVCDRRGERRRGNKGDVKDAERLSEDLWRGRVRPVYHGGGERGLRLKELSRAYRNLVEGSRRAMQRLKALYRARGIRTAGRRLYHPARRAEWLGKLEDAGARLRAELLFRELDVLRELREEAKRALVAEARRDPAWEVLKTIPYLGPVRLALLLAVMQTPWRFRTKRNLWAYVGLAVVTQTSSEYDWQDGQAVRRLRPAMTRGLNRNGNRVLKEVFKGAAAAAVGRPGPFRDFYEGLLERGKRPAMARVTLARKIAAVMLSVWKTGEAFDPAKLSMQAQ